MGKVKAIITFSIIHLAVTCAIVNAQTPTRIQFAKGKSSATVTGMTGRYGMSYVVRAKSGQKLVLTLDPSSKVGIKVETIGRFGEMVLLREERGGTYEVGLEETGDYIIFIGSTNGRSVPFKLSVRITKLSEV
ncbi:MAG TPA: hypothetical protein VJL58_00170 [Pyrinomonadaceae bacterium]|nr:hypothetical protein [Pyrinomonadaceae bacterium]